jgi:hypothetical protein
MSKGGAGKVYFVLYLAVILELLIIIVERDEAEEGLIKKQQESMRIVESILTQLQSGAGTEGINTRPQDAIILSEKLPVEQQKYFKKFRTYFVEVGVTDVSSALNMDGLDDQAKKEKMETLKKLANVQELQYEIYHHPSTELDPPLSPPSTEFKKVELNPVAGTKLANPPNSTITESWELLASSKLELNSASMKDYNDPVYNESTVKTGDINKYAPQDSVSTKSVFKYSALKTELLTTANSKKLTKRAFIANFQPDQTKEGWYKLRFSSRTNRIMGISADQNIATLSDDAKVNIGTVQLKVKDLRSVQRQLSEDLSDIAQTANKFASGTIDVEKFDNDLDNAKKTMLESKDEKRVEKASRIDLYRYIAKLLSPGKYMTFDQNKGSIEIDIYVKKPDIQQDDPFIKWSNDGQIYSFDKANKYVATFEANLYNIATPIVTFSNGKSVSITKIGQPSASGKQGQYKVEYNGSLPPGEYTFTATLKNSSNVPTSQIMKLEVFETGLAVDKYEDAGNIELIDGQDILSGYLTDLSKGDPIDFTVVPTSRNKIPATQFQIIVDGIKNDTNSKLKTEKISGLKIGAASKYFVPLESDEVSMKIIWIDPNDANSNFVQIFPKDGSAFSTPTKFPKPSIRDKEPGNNISINNPKKPIIEKTFIVNPPSVPGSSVEVSGVKIELVSQSFKNYRIEKIGEEKIGNEYKIRLSISKGKLPIPKGTSGQIEIRVTAIATSNNGSSTPKPKNFLYNLLY